VIESIEEGCKVVEECYIIIAQAIVISIGNKFVSHFFIRAGEATKTISEPRYVDRVSG
jgi:hypothetical protein